MVQSEKAKEIRKQVEYYLSDANLKRDKFFHGKISEDANGWLEIQCILNCNKIKQMKITQEDIALAVVESKDVEVSDDKAKVRRTGGKALPELAVSSKKREDKDESKSGKAAEGKADEEAKDEHPEWLTEEDFNSPHVIRFTAKNPPEGYKMDWKALIELVKKDCPKIKIAYIRGDETQGEMAVSKHKLA